MKIAENNSLHPLLQKIIDWLLQNGVGDVYITPDGHLFLQPSKAIKALWGALDVKKEGAAAGVRVVVRRAKKRTKRSKYTGLPMIQLYVLPIVKKEAQTMTDAEGRNMELNRQALVMAHAVEKAPEQLALYHELHEAHKLNPVGYKKLYKNFFGFLVATFRMQLAAQEAERTAQEMLASAAGTTSKETTTCIRLCMPRTQRLPRYRTDRRTFRPFIRLPMVA